MNGSLEMSPVAGRAVQTCEGHGIVGVGNRKSLTDEKETPSPGNECFAENDWSDRENAKLPSSIVQTLGRPPEAARVERLKIVRGLAKLLEPGDEGEDCVFDTIQTACVHIVDCGHVSLVHRGREARP